MSPARKRVYAPGPANVEPLENDFRKMLVVELCKLPGVRVFPQNCGEVPIRNEHGDVIRRYNPGPPVGAADITGGLKPEGIRIEIELKSSTGRRSPEQVRWGAFCVAQGYIYALYQYDEKLSREQNLMIACDAVSIAIQYRRSHA